MQRTAIILLVVFVLTTSFGCAGISRIFGGAGSYNNVVDDAEFRGDPNFGTDQSPAPDRLKTPQEIYKEFDAVLLEIVFGESWEFSQGSGFPVKINGEPHILTAEHLVHTPLKGKGVFAYFKNSVNGGEEVRFIINDPVFDWALAKFQNPNFIYRGSYPILGSSKDLKVGDTVVAIGSPGMGEPHSFSIGNVRQFMSGRNMGHFQPRLIIHSADLEPGCSGGPLLNLRGEVVGIHIKASLKMSAAVPIEDVVAAVRRVEKSGRLKHPYLDFKLIESRWLNSLSYTEFLKIKAPDQPCLVVYVVEAETSLAKAGIKRGDIVLECAGLKFEKADEVYRHLILNFKPGDQVNFKVLRDEQTLTFAVTLSEPTE